MPSYYEIECIAIELEENLNKESKEFEELVTYVAMNWTRSYFRLRKLLPFDKSLIEQCRQQFIRKMIRPYWLTKIYEENKDKGLVHIQIEMALIVLWAKDEIVRSGPDLWGAKPI